jgi:uncharacterized protein YjbI with pentapeptide repeats
MLEENRLEMERLRARWETEQGQTLIRDVLNAMTTNLPWTPLLRNQLPDVVEVENGRDLRGAPLGASNLSGLQLRDVRFDFADLRRAVLERADLRGSDLTYADLREAQLASANFEGCLMPKVDLRDADLSGARLARAVLAGANLENATFLKADCSYTTFLGANTSGAIFQGAVLQNSRFGEFAKEE